MMKQAGSLVSRDVMRDLTIYVDPSIASAAGPCNWAAAVDSAIRYWNWAATTSSSILKFRTVPAQSQAKITVTSGTVSGSTGEQAQVPFPSSGNPGTPIIVDLVKFNAAQLGCNGDAPHLIGHELAHAIGLAHPGPTGSGDITAVSVPLRQIRTR